MCNPAVGPSLIQHWAKQGYVTHGTESHGSVKRLTFSFSELVYLGLLVRLSWFGAVSKETLVSYRRTGTGYNPDEPATVALKEYLPQAFVREDGINFTANLTIRFLILKILEIYDWNMLVTVAVSPVTIPSATARSKQVDVRYRVGLHAVEEVKFEVVRGFDFSDAIGFIDARWIHDDVARTLGIT